ncbi:MAG: 4Fe-4S ferredoxin [Bdellovibrionales bacterium GWA2_49_15]|nr:MAG: 4Fe-4S ferredoxin [Bdellovibrionales bacterium GWA2_49_15]HAZ12485.1 4Fe-4S ferredoxin [Bdellovibrionales bacterium]
MTLLTFGFWHHKLFGQQSVDDTKASGEPSEANNYAMAVDIAKCIGCGRCANACKKENHVPEGPHTMRTWIERYIIPSEGETMVDSPNGGIDGFPDRQIDSSILRTFFVPKLCNHCANPPCVQVCPVGATFQTKDGVVLVDESYCVGCRYCIQACPYGARYMHPEKNVADKCTFCYHRIAKGLLPACVEVCPTQARVFGDLNKRSSPLHHFLRFHPIRTLKSELNTRPKAFYANADQEVR